MKSMLFCLVLIFLSDASRGFIPLYSARNTVRLYDVTSSLQILDKYNRDYLLRLREGRKEGLTPTQIEFRRVQELKADAIKAERATLKCATHKRLLKNLSR